MTSCENSCGDTNEKYVEGCESAYNKYVKNHCDLTYDEKLKPAIADGLTRLPWIGKSYSQAKMKVLIVAESHYVNSKKNLALFNREFSTRYIIWESRIADAPCCRPYTIPQYNNLERVLTGIRSLRTKGREDFWEHVAFYNFVQRTMDTRMERPTWDDFSDGWKYFIDVVKELKPDVCLFSGVTASHTFDGQMKELGVSYEPVEKPDAVAGIYPRVGAINLGDYHLPLVFIRHCSNYFSWPTWHTYLQRTFTKVTACLHEICNSDVGQVSEETERLREETITFGDSVDVPMWLNHRPIFAARYEDMSDYDPQADAKFVSVGLAQYDPESISVKIFRRSGDRWSRQSEELPIFRALMPAIALLKAIVATQTRDVSGVEPLVLKAPENLESFLNALGDPEIRRILARHINDLKALVSAVDLDRMGVSWEEGEKG